jgi:hypothetical protein
MIILLEVIVADVIALRQAAAEAQSSAHHHSGIVEVTNVVVGDVVVVALSNPHAHPVWNDAAATLDDVVVQGNVVRLLVDIASNRAFFTDTYPALA